MSDKNIVSIEDRIPKLKQARKKKANRRLIFYLSIFFLLIAIIVYLQSPLSQIRSIEVNGNKFLTDERIIDDSGLTEGTNIWSMNRSSIEDRLENNPVIDEATVNRKFPRTVQVTVVEQAVLGYVKEGAEFNPVLENGEIIPTDAKEVAGNAPLMIGFEEKQLTRLTSEMTNLRHSIFSMISEIELRNIDEEDHSMEIMLYMNDGYMVNGNLEQVMNKLSYYPSIVSQLEDDKGIIHIGVGIYFESFNKNEMEEVEVEEAENEEESGNEESAE